MDITFEEFLPLILFYVIFFSVFSIFGIISYVFRGIGMYSMAKKLGVSAPCMAFIPVVRSYLQGKLAGEIQFKEKSIKNPGLWMLLAPIIFGAVFGLLYVGMIVIIVVGAIAADNMYYAHDLPPAFILPMIGMILVLVVVAIVGQAVIYGITGLVNYNIHKKYVNNNGAVLHMLLGLFVPLYQSIYFFILRNREPLAPESTVEVLPAEPIQ